MRLRLIPLVAVALAAFPAFGATPRDSVLLDDGWKFIKQDVAGGSQAQFDDSKWQPITIPHTWNNLDGEDGGSNYYRGPGWYRRHFQIDAADAGKSLFLKFDGASSVADVYVNGKQAGTHKGAFGAFCFDITPLVHMGGDNVVAVRVSNAKDPNVAPLSGDFTLFGGIYRDVHLLTLNKLSISPLDDASPGIYLKEHDISAKSASVNIETVLRNDTASARTVALRYTVTNAAGAPVLTATGSQEIAASGTAMATSDITIKNPHLWAGRPDPYLYKVRVDVMDGNTLADREEQPLGLRYAKVDVDHGLFLNGKHYALHGVNRHQDRKDKGWAIGRAEHQEDFNLIMEMGCTGIRLAHYQHAEFFYSLCDKGGLVVWAELPLVNALGTGEFDINAKQQLNELIKQNYNHPSIIFWSLSNELHDGNHWVNPPPDWSLIQKLNDYVHQIDPSRITALAAAIDPDNDLNRVTDVIGFNRYPGWYYTTPEKYGEELDKLRKELPGHPIGMSEFGAGANINQHEINPKQPKPGGDWHPEEWQSHVEEAAWMAMEKRPWLWCEFVWNMFDFASDGRNEGAAPGINDKGLVSYDRKTKKDAFYWYKANWSNEPMVHINSSAFTPRPLGPTSIRIYSNLPSVRLAINGKSLGTRTSADHIFNWDGVAIVGGTNTVTATAQSSKGPVTDTCTWEGEAGAPARMNFPPPRPSPAKE
ncbi:MAG TPA: glycoside hydrolase family 2 TIM barrel-domain containing protein [Chthoniobacteraceae bacterium]|jgi:beta-galactosidase|nr:glycoside hydrolase family 2 TIM barrel-domain containing protein [Chthoniobacteraceae bacterium]